MAGNASGSAGTQQDALINQRLHLRPLTLDDAAWMARESSRPEIARMGSRVPIPNPVLAAEGFILMMRAAERVRGDRLRIAVLENGDRLGVLGLHPRRDGDVEFGYWYARPAWGRGYATRAGRQMLDEAANMKTGRIVAGHFEDNPASGRVLEKLGFVYTGETSMDFSLGRLAAVRCLRMARTR